MRYGHPKSFLDTLLYAFGVVGQSLYRLGRINPRDIIDLETVADEQTVVMSDGTLVSVISIEGVAKTMLVDEFAIILDRVTRSMGAYMRDGSHYFSFYFDRDSAGVREDLERIYGGARVSTARFDADFSDLIDEQIDVLADRCARERCLLLLWTTKHGLSQEEKIIFDRRRQKQRHRMPMANDAQDFGSGADQLLQRHRSFVSEFSSDLNTLAYTSRVLTSHEYLFHVRNGIDSALTPDDWRPSLPGDPITPRMADEYMSDYSGFFWPRLPEQLFPRGAEIIDYSNSIVRVGDTVFAPITVELMPKSPEPFQSLFRRLQDESSRSGIPWRMNALVRNDGMDLFGIKAAAASILEWTGASENRYLMGVRDSLQELKDSGEEIVKYQITFCTWAPANSGDLIEERRATLARCVSGWGDCQVAAAEGDALETMLCSLPGAVLGSVARPSAAPLYDVFKMSPVGRPASAWEEGSQPLRTKDGKLMPYQPYSSKQTAWITLIFAPMGYGKSVFMNYSNLSLVLSPDCTELPFIRIIDVGPSSRGLIQLIRGALPERLKHLAVYERLKNSAEYAINVFDTPLGLRTSLPNHRSFLQNFIEFLALPDNSESPAEGTLGFATKLVEVSYRIAASPATGKRYEPRILPAVDSVLERLAFVADENMTLWWDVVDLLANNGDTHLAMLAQRYAVPNLKDVVSACKRPALKDTYAELLVRETSEPMVTYMMRKLTDAIDRYPLVAGITRFDLGESRVVSLDLDEVAKGDGASGKRAAGLMYMLSFHVLSQDFFMAPSHLAEIPVAGEGEMDYRKYHAKRVDAVGRLPKRLCIDEKHRLRGLTSVENQIDVMVREGRKHKIDVVQASQLPDDFSEASVRLATNVFILGGGNASNIEKVSETFHLSESMRYHLGLLRKPGRAGATLLALMESDNVWYEHMLMSTQGPRFLWATNTTRDDAYVRDYLSAEIGDVAARDLLVSKFPSGTIEAEIARRKRNLSVNSDDGYSGEDLSSASMNDDADDTAESMLQELAQDLLKEYERRNRLALSA